MFGFGLRPESVAWYLGASAPKTGKPRKAFGEIHLRPPDYLAQLAQGNGFAAAAASAVLPLASLFPRAIGSIELRGDVVRAKMVWQMK